jgi:hypothetical protein
MPVSSSFLNFVSIIEISFFQQLQNFIVLSAIFTAVEQSIFVSIVIIIGSFELLKLEQLLHQLVVV